QLTGLAAHHPSTGRTHPRTAHHHHPAAQHHLHRTAHPQPRHVAHRAANATPTSSHPRPRTPHRCRLPEQAGPARQLQLPGLSPAPISNFGPFLPATPRQRSNISPFFGPSNAGPESGDPPFRHPVHHQRGTQTPQPA